MNGLLEFLAARLAEDEAIARDAEAQVGDGSWQQRNARVVTVADRDREVADFAIHECIEHIVRHDPARVLAEVRAKQRILGLHVGVVLRGGAGSKYFDTATVCKSCEPPQFAEDAWPCPTLKLLALPYWDHLLYDESWKP